MQKNKTTNGFGDGINLDLNPLQTPNTVMTNALNATLVTMNGNEQTLLNDMGNGRVETAYLPEGFIPLGSAELGGIIYIVSYNPLIDRCLIGSFPSPERNITSDELDGTNQSIKEDNLYSNIDEINSPYVRKELTDFELNPGDKYVIVCPAVESAKTDDGYSYISAFGENYNFNSRLLPRYLRFSVVAISFNGQVIDMSDSCVWLKLLTYDGYYILNTTGNIDTDTGKVDLDEYRDLITSQYNVFACKHSGKLGVLVQFECIDTFEVAWDALKIDGKWNFYFYTNWTYENDLEPDKINLFGIRYSGQIDEKSISGGDIIIENYPILYKSLLTSIIDPIYETCIATTDIMGNDMPGLTISNPTTNKLKHVESDSDYYDFEFLMPYYIEDLPVDYLENGIDPYSKKIVYDEEGNIITEDIINNGNTLSRRNDGSDNQFLICDPVTVETDEGIFKLNIKPLMPYGALNWLELNFTIDLSKLGSGIIDLVEYRYYILNGKVTLNWGLDAYPERNRKINGVTFNFYKIDSEIIKWIKDENNAGYIDNNKLIDGKWCEQGTKNYAEENADTLEKSRNFGFDTSSKSSYSGHFTENLIIYQEDEVDNPDVYLIDGKTYLLEINVDYNGNSIKYYRIFYTQPIFNKYYYSDTDFATIKLDNENNDNLNLSFVADNISYLDESTTTILDPDGKKVQEIPSYLDKEEHPDSQELKYTIETVLSETNLEFDITGSTSYDLFKVDAELDENYSTIAVSSYENHNEAGSDYYTNGVSRSDTTVAETEVRFSPEELGGKFEGNRITIDNFDLIVDTSVDIDYSKSSQLNVQYEMTDLDIASYIISGSGTTGSVSLQIGQTSTTYYNEKNLDFESPSDDVYTEMDVNSSEGIYDVINNALQDNDIVCLGGVLYKNTYKKRYGHTTGIGWGFGDIRNANGVDNANDILLNRWYTICKSDLKENPTYTCMILLYAIKYSNSVALFTYLSKDNNATKWNSYSCFPGSPYLAAESNYWNKSEDRANNYIGGSPFIFVYNSITSSDQILSGMIKYPFSNSNINLYKVKDCAETYNVWEWAIFTYVPTFTMDYGVDVTVTKAEIQLHINGDVEVPPNLAVNNLYYESPRDLVVTYRNSTRIKNDSIIESITNSSKTFIIYDKGTENLKIAELDVNPNKLYNRSSNNTFTVVNYLPDFIGNDSTTSVGFENGSLKLLSSGNYKITAFWAYEEQVVGFKNVYLI